MTIYGTQATVSISTDGINWSDIGGAVEAETDLTLQAEPFSAPTYIAGTIEFTVTWTWHAPFALSLPPAGCLPMFN